MYSIIMKNIYFIYSDIFLLFDRVTGVLYFFFIKEKFNDDNL